MFSVTAVRLSLSEEKVGYSICTCVHLECVSLGYFSVQWPNIGTSVCFDSAQIGKEDKMDLRTVSLLSL